MLILMAFWDMVQFYLSAFVGCVQQMLYGNEICFFFFDSDPSLSFTLVERPRCFLLGQFAPEIFSFRVDRSTSAPEFGTFIMGTKSFGAFTCTSLAVHHVCFNDPCIWHIEEGKEIPFFRLRDAL